MKEARFLIRLENAQKATPERAEQLRDQLRRQVREGSVMNLRVTPFALEFDFFFNAESPEEMFSKWSEVGRVLNWRRLDGTPPAKQSAEKTIQEARTLFNEGRYWEVHEALESLWLRSQGAEKRLLQGLIMVSAAQVHAQRNDGDGVVWSLLKDGLERLEGQPDEYYGWNIAQFRAVFIESTRTRQLPALRV